MDHARPQDTQQSKGSMLRPREHSDESADKRPPDGSASPSLDKKRLIRRVRSPSRPRAWLSNSYKPKLGARVQRREDHFYKPGFANQKYQHLNHRGNFHRRGHFHPKLHQASQRNREREEKERYEPRESGEGGSPSKQNNTSRPFLPRPSSNRDKDMQFLYQSDRSQSRESKERERSRERELPSAASQTATRDRAIQHKRREIDEVYYQECEMFGLVAKMLIAKDPTLEQSIQSALQENLRDIGKRCVEGMEKFIEEYDSKELPQQSESQTSQH
ncbi:periphilin-1 [Trematomus bernacchii]|uniref:periphilin-1 n=1 Tax=Trematomus bernacchii TaxID=40690 RepID=UPI00146D6A8C|nr:periphilin-1 [Trematomus bernacchii]XP_033982532.1 periphilin-1 [Trematomus bernacchii]